jgi:hypothetical protein
MEMRASLFSSRPYEWLRKNAKTSEFISSFWNQHAEKKMKEMRQVQRENIVDRACWKRKTSGNV